MIHLVPRRICTISHLSRTRSRILSDGDVAIGKHLKIVNTTIRVFAFSLKLRFTVKHTLTCGIATFGEFHTRQNDDFSSSSLFPHANCRVLTFFFHRGVLASLLPRRHIRTSFSPLTCSYAFFFLYPPTTAVNRGTRSVVGSTRL